MAVAGQPDTRPLRLTKVHVLLERRGVDVTYATLCRWAHYELGFRERKPTVRVDDPDPGQEAQVDFGKMGMLDDPATGKRRTLWCLIVTLSFSRTSSRVQTGPGFRPVACPWDGWRG